jgi:class 3 adenylate cyclase
LIEAFHTKVREMLQQYRGRQINTAGDGFLAAFDGPARAIRCAGAIRDTVRSLGLDRPMAAERPSPRLGGTADILREIGER